MMTDLEDSDLGQPAPVKSGIDLCILMTELYSTLSSNYYKNNQLM